MVRTGKQPERIRSQGWPCYDQRTLSLSSDK